MAFDKLYFGHLLKLTAMRDIKQNSLWYKDAIIYELHVKAFYDSNGDGIGDFRGLMEKLDYIQDLGVTAIWLLPFYPSPLRDDGYDISNYCGVHPSYGSMRDFKALVREVHRRGLRIITELVVNHTSDQHPWFQMARKAKPGSARRSFYIWSDVDTKFSESRIIFTDTETSNWAWDSLANAYYWHRFFSHQPDLNLNNPKVVQAVTKIMRFWLDIGVDGMRLDAIPYLCVREGTNNENLPETHAVIKEWRRQLDLHYKDRMFLAEANQWPQDVCRYFGQGDECHMAFHFPLMPRIFMGIRKEDRHPITEIIRQTPDIPETCQWAIFLRNHDELTLEMVTDEERDYMYREYAKDHRMRCNIGIRRRMAPLMDNSLRRMELLNSLLLSFPGTPIIYYGDEIGMGDNIYLGDRNSVRTPMQWSADRNAGFSKADPAKLYLPVLMDPVYGYGAVNIEGQQRNPSSFLHFMKRIIALRRQHKAFGRGSMEFLYPENRKVLAYLRRYKGEIILVVANLSRFVQPVELDLSEFRGWTPVEMIGRVEFPLIGELPYFLTLGPHAFYWFRLEPQAEPVEFSFLSKRGEPVLPSMSLDSWPDSLLESKHLNTLEKDVLPAFFTRQRWFQGKAREIQMIKITDYCKLGAGFNLTFALVGYKDGGQEIYVLPLKVTVGEQAERLWKEVPESLIAWVKTSKGKGVLYDALSDRTACGDMLSVVLDGRRYITASQGKILAFPTITYDEAQEPLVRCAKVRRLTSEQTNTSIILDEAFVLKLFRRIEKGINPDMGVGLYLTERTDFTNIAQVTGGIIYTDPDGSESTVAMLQAFVPNQGDGWQYAVEALKRYYEERRAYSVNLKEVSVESRSLLQLTKTKISEHLRDAIGPFLYAAGTLGKLTAKFHLALSGERHEKDFIPEPLSGFFLETLAERFSRQAQEAMELLKNRIEFFPEDVQKKIHMLLMAEPYLIKRFYSLSSMKTSAVRIRCHGDYHLGQVLRTEDDFIIIDFEGEPMRSLAERKEKHSPLKDVAGMLRSFNYAAYISLTDFIRERPKDLEALAPWASAWKIWVSVEFLREYLGTANGAEFLPDNDDQLEMLLEAFLLDKAFYELNYELNNRPDWIYIPLDGILELISIPVQGSGS